MAESTSSACDMTELLSAAECIANKAQDVKIDEENINELATKVRIFNLCLKASTQFAKCTRFVHEYRKKNQRFYILYNSLYSSYLQNIVYYINYVQFDSSTVLLLYAHYILYPQLFVNFF